MMNSDDLCALADALEPMARAPRFEDFDVPGFCAWVRDCADVQPVRAVPIGHALSAVRHVGSANYPDRERAAIERLYSAEFDAYTHPAPAAPQAEPSAALIRAYNSGYMQGHHDTVEAQFIVIHPLDMDTYHADVVAELGLTAAPQAEPCIGNDPICPCQDGDACHYKDAADGTKAWPVPQAEPKREPLSDEPTGAPYGIIDPDYGRVYTIARKLAWEEGYAIGLHGSFTRDLDLIAVPWADTACEPEHLIRRIVEATGLKLRDGVGVKPHGRRAWTLLFPAFGDPRFVDISVVPRIGGSDE